MVLVGWDVDNLKLLTTGAKVCESCCGAPTYDCPITCSIPDWNTNFVYAISDYVCYGGVTWVSESAANQGNVPSGPSEYWTQTSEDCLYNVFCTAEYVTSACPLFPAGQVPKYIRIAFADITVSTGDDPYGAPWDEIFTYSLNGCYCLTYMGYTSPWYLWQATLPRGIWNGVTFYPDQIRVGFHAVNAYLATMGNSYYSAIGSRDYAMFDVDGIGADVSYLHSDNHDDSIGLNGHACLWNPCTETWI